jgi:hypothetical protein
MCFPNEDNAQPPVTFSVNVFLHEIMERVK